MIETEEKLAIARSYGQIEKTLAFTDFRKWISEEVEMRESELTGLSPEKKHLFEAYFLKWQAWKSLELAVSQHIQVAAETIKENQNAGEPDSADLVPSSFNSTFLPGY
jgi:hypothetical protein